MCSLLGHRVLAIIHGYVLKMHAIAMVVMPHTACNYGYTQIHKEEKLTLAIGDKNKLYFDQPTPYRLHTKNVV